MSKASISAWWTRRSITPRRKLTSHHCSRPLRSDPEFAGEPDTDSEISSYRTALPKTPLGAKWLGSCVGGGRMLASPDRRWG